MSKLNDDFDIIGAEWRERRSQDPFRHFFISAVFIRWALPIAGATAILSVNS